MFGTVGYLAPEAIEAEGVYDEKIDLYSIGVIIYNLVTHEELFIGTDAQVKKQTLSKQPRLSQKAQWASYSDDLKDLVQGLLCKDPSKRLGVKEVLEHQWLADVVDGKTKMDDNLCSLSDASQE